MSNSYDSAYRSKSFLTTQNIILACIGWAVLALLYFLLLSAKIDIANCVETRGQWYVLGTNIFEAVAYFGATVLCLKNWFSPQVISNRLVWLCLGVAMLSYFIGGLIFGYIEIVLNEDPEVSIADVFFVLTYILLGVGMTFAVISRRINLEKWQWLIVFAIGVFGSLLAWWISQQPQQSAVAATKCPEVVQKAPGTAQKALGTAQKAPELQKTPELSQKAQEPVKDESSEFLALVLNTFYVVSDVLLLIIATAMLLAFWGGRVSLSWRMIAAAAFSLYIADMWFKFASQGANYQSGDIPEVCWVFSGVLFGLGAVLEYEASLSLKRRASARKRT
jgi:hypothetical protein